MDKREDAQIVLRHVTKKYNGTVVLNQIDQSFYAGQSIAFMGHNGCGKSTLLKIMAGLIAVTSGEVRYQSSLRFHYVPEKFMPLSLNARTYLKRMGELDGLSGDEIRKRTERLGEDFFLAELLDVPMRHLSKGTLQKIGVIQAIMKTPDILLLDEPLSGQDADSQKVFIQKINDLRNRGVTIFMACHEQRLVDAIAERTYTIHKGELTDFRPREERNYTLFVRTTADREPEPGMKRFGEGYCLTVAESEAQAKLMELMAGGWELRGMSDEKSE